MLKKSNRINKTRDLQKVYRSGKTAHTPALVIKFLEGDKLRFGFVVSKKVSKRAVERNRIKRALREELRLNMKKLSSGEYMIVAKAGAAAIENSELRGKMINALIKSKLCES